MAKNCKLAFLDKNGNKSASYYGNLHLGEVTARRLYLEAMAPVAFTKFSKKMEKVNKMLELSRSIQLPTEERNTYKLSAKMGGKDLNRMTEWLGSVTGKVFRMEETARQVAETQLGKDMVKANPEAYDTTELALKKLQNGQKGTIGIKLKDFPAAELAAKAWVADPANAEKWEKKWKKVVALWDHKREAGTDIHDLIERFVLERNKLVKDKDGWWDIDAAKNTALEGMDYKDDHKHLLDQIDTFLDKVGGDGSKMRFEPEVCLWDSELEIAGRIDLLAFDEHGRAYIFDYKTKERGKEWLFDAKFDRMPDPMGELFANRETDGALQTAGYRLILERMGIPVVETKIIYIEADVVDEGDKFRYTNFGHKKDVNLRNYRTQLGRAFLKKNGTDINKKDTIEPGKWKSANDIMQYVSDHETLDGVMNIKRSVAYKLNKLKTTPEGRDYFINDNTGKKVFFKSPEKAEREAQLTEYYEEEKLADRAARLSGELIEFFHKEQKSWNSKKSANAQTEVEQARARQARSILKGITEDTHSLEQLNNSYGFSDISSTVLLAINKVTREAKIINVNNRLENPFNINEDTRKSKTHNTIFGKFHSNQTIQRKYKGVEGLQATDTNLKFLRSGIIAMELKKQGVIKSIESVVDGAITGSDDATAPPVTMNMRDILVQINVLNDIAEESGLQSAYYKELFNDKELTDPANWNNNNVAELTRLLSGGITNNFDKKQTKGVLDAINQFNAGEIKQQDLVKELMANRKRLAKSLVQEGGKREDASRVMYQHRDYVLLCKVILEYLDIELSMGDTSGELTWESKARTTSRMGNLAISRLDWQVKNDKEQLARKFHEWNNEHKSLLKELKAGNNGSNDNIFDEMFLSKSTLKRTEDSDVKDLHNMFKLKEAGSPGLTKAQNDYIRFFNKSVKDGFGQILTGADKTRLDEGKSWKEGQIPMMRQSGRSKVKETENLMQKIKVSLTTELNKDIKNTEKNFDEISAYIKGKFTEQLNRGAGEISQGRLDMLGVDPDGVRNSDDIMGLETHLEHVLNNFMVETGKIAEFETTLGAYNSINMIAWIDQNEHFKNSDDIRQYMDEYIKMIVLEEFNDESTLGKFVDKSSTIISKAAFAFTLSQPLLEAGTNLFGSTSAMISQMMMGKQKRFSPKSWFKAGAMILGDAAKGMTSKDATVAQAIVRTFSLYSSDAGALGSDEFQETRAKMTFWKSAFYLNNLPFKMFRTQAFIAELVHEGIADALTVDEHGNLVYNPEHDKRFESIFEKDGTLKDKDKLVGDKDKVKARALYDFLLEQLEKEGGVSADGKPLRPIFNAESISKKDYSRSLFGTMDSDSKTTGQLQATWRSLFKFRSWAISKKDNYWTKTSKSKVRGHTNWVVDETHEDGGYYDFQHATMEGIIQTLGFIGKNILDIQNTVTDGKGKSLKDAVWGDLDRNQKENIAKMTSDLMMWGVLIGLFGLLFDDEYWKKGEGKLVAKTLNNAVMDLNILSTFTSMTETSPFAAIGYLQRTLGACYDSAGYLATGEAGKGMNRFASTLGVTKNVAAFIE